MLYSMKKQDDHKKNPYQRPSCAYRCGRASRWQKPCWQGPDSKGQCISSTECSPTQRGDRYYCQRPVHAGGACNEGPLPDGKCAHEQKKCKPRLTLRKWRGRIVLLMTVLLISLFGLMTSRSEQSLKETIENPFRYFMVSPGPLSTKHSGFFDDTKGCEGCHDNHKGTLTNWIGSLFNSADPTKKCLSCHQFAGGLKRQEMAAHNFPATRKISLEKQNSDLSCTACHSEHKGTDHDISQVSNQICASCHQKEKNFKHFKDHTDFSTTFPHQDEQGIFFNHGAHGKHFPAAKEKPHTDKQFIKALLQKSGKVNCKVCHDIDQAGRYVPIRSYEKTCAACHAEQIEKNTLVLMTNDEEKGISPIFLNIWKDEFNKILVNQATSPAKALEEILKIINEKGQKGLEEQVALNDHDNIDEAMPRHLFSGLSPSLLQKIAKAWASKEAEYKPYLGEDLQRFGWVTDENKDGLPVLIYRIENHADLVVTAWIEFYLKKLRHNPSNKMIETLLTEEGGLLHKQGPGACGKCHGSLVGAAKEGKEIYWGETPAQARPYTEKFNHSPHINFVDKGKQCSECHVKKTNGDFKKHFESYGKTPYVASFVPIKKEKCQECHAKDKLAANCQMCHQYHNDVSFKTDHSSQPKKVPKKPKEAMLLEKSTEKQSGDKTHE